MAVIALPLASTVAVRNAIGSTPTGNTISRKKTFKFIRADATDQDVYDIVQGLVSLMEDPLIDIVLSKHFELVEE